MLGSARRRCAKSFGEVVALLETIDELRSKATDILQAQYTDTIEEDRDAQNTRIFNLLPNNRFPMQITDVACVFTNPGTTVDQLMLFCSRQQRPMPCYIYDSKRDGEAWVEEVLKPFALKNLERIGPVLVVNVWSNPALKAFFGERARYATMCCNFQGLFYGSEHHPIDLNRILHTQHQVMGN